MDAITEHLPEFKQKLKVHLMLHLVDDIIDFGPTSAFNTERFGIMHKIITEADP